VAGRIRDSGGVRYEPRHWRESLRLSDQWKTRRGPVPSVGVPMVGRMGLSNVGGRQMEDCRAARISAGWPRVTGGHTAPEMPGGLRSDAGGIARCGASSERTHGRGCRGRARVKGCPSPGGPWSAAVSLRGGFPAEMGGGSGGGKGAGFAADRSRPVPAGTGIRVEHQPGGAWVSGYGLPCVCGSAGAMPARK